MDGEIDCKIVENMVFGLRNQKRSINRHGFFLHDESISLHPRKRELIFPDDAVKISRKGEDDYENYYGYLAFST